MTLLRTTPTILLGMTSDSLVEKLLAQMLFRTGHGAGPAEQTSWGSSLPVLAADLMAAGLGQVEMLVEYHLPLTSQRADVVLCGTHPRTGEASYVVVELKQWSAARSFEGSVELVVVPGMPGGPKQHPVRQVQGYCSYLADFLRTLEHQPDALAGLAYLHNATDPAAVADLRRYPVSTTGRLFTAADRGDLLDFLRSRLSPEPGASAADTLLRSAVAPSKQLLKVAAGEVREREQFRLVGNQQLAVDLVGHAVEQSRAANTKRVIVVTGGPGSGKSVIALSLLGELSREGRAVLHATGSRSFTQTLRKVAGQRAPQVQRMFQYFNSFMTAKQNDLDVLILDEAHRIRESSVNRWTKAEHRSSRPQIDELLSAARVPVFLLDEHQVVRPGEQGTVEEIERHAAARGIPVRRISLDQQFRCGGSEVFVTWVKRLLGLEPGGPIPWVGDPHFIVEVVESPAEMEHVLSARQAEGYNARIAAGYCWPWSDPRPDGSLVRDVTIGLWSRPWNLKGERSIGGAPPAALWATDPAGFDQVGCVYTAQGFEYDYAGVIIGPDLVWRDDRWVAIRGANRDPDFRNREKVSDAEFDRLVRNVYKVLLTRGMQGVSIYSTDHGTQALLKSIS